MVEPLLQVRDLAANYNGVPVLDHVGFDLHAGETLALIGPSGSGKSTLARALLRLHPIQSGSIIFAGEDWLALPGSILRKRRAAMQMVFQDSLSAFNPRARIGDVLNDPLRIHGCEGNVGALLRMVGLDPALAHRSIYEVSGGQRQRVAIARALATKPTLIVLDEAVSALDATVRASILALLRTIQQTENMASLFISHDLAVAGQIADRIAVMEGGRIVECCPTRELIAAPQTPIAKALLAAVPRFNPSPVASTSL